MLAGIDDEAGDSLLLQNNNGSGLVMDDKKVGNSQDYLMALKNGDKQLDIPSLDATAPAAAPATETEVQ